MFGTEDILVRLGFSGDVVGILVFGSDDREVAAIVIGGDEAEEVTEGSWRSVPEQRN